MTILPPFFHGVIDDMDVDVQEEYQDGPGTPPGFALVGRQEGKAILAEMLASIIDSVLLLKNGIVYGY